MDISNLTRRALPVSKSRLQTIKEKVLGKKYELSLVFVGKKRSHNLNKKHRGKDYPADVLSFPLEKSSGEIFINLDIQKEAKEHDMSYKAYIEFLLIHGALHLKGLDHGKKMSKEEDKYLKLLTK